MNEIVFFSKFQTGKQIELFQLFRDFSTYETSVFYTESDKGTIWNKIGNAKIWDKPHRTIKNKIIIIDGYSDYFLDLNASNKIVYFTNKPTLDHREVMLLGKINYIIAENKFDAFNIAYQVKHYNQKIKVYWMHPWADVKRYTINKYQSGYVETSNQNWMTKALAQVGPKHKRFNVNTKANFCAEPNNLYEATQYLLSGRPILASRKFQELIINGFNGYIADDLGEAITSINALKNIEHAQKLGMNGRIQLEAKLEPYQYIKDFRKIISGETPELAQHKYNKDFSARKWVVTEKILTSGKFRRSPEFNQEFNASDLEDFNEIIEFFSKQLFSEVYVFGFWFPEYDRHELAKARNLVNRLGNKGWKIHFCLDQPIPDEWDHVFNKLSVISREEGLKQVR